MDYHFSTELSVPFDEAVDKVTSALKDEGFGVLTDIDVKATMKTKLDADMRPYRILGACNPPNAFRALEAEPRIGLMLPCNVIVRETGDGVVEVSAIDPVASMMAVENEGLGATAAAVRERLKRVIGKL